MSSVDAVVDAADRIAQVAATSSTFDTGNDETHVRWRVWGEGRPLVLLHGNAGSWQHWIANIDRLSRHYRVVVPDLPGFGESGDPPPPPTGETLARILASGLPSVIGGERFDIAGFSMGGSVAAELVAHFPHLVDHLVLVGCGRGFGVASADYGPLRRWRSLEDPAERWAAHLHNLRALMLSHHSPDDAVALVVHAGSTEARRLRFERDGSPSRHRSILTAFSGKLAGIWGAEDAVMGPHADARMQFVRSFQPDARLALIPAAGHWVQYERAERFNETILEILDQ